jgi:hypothetical protein
MTKDEALKMRAEQDEQWEKLVNRKWQGLTDEEIQAIRIKTFDAVATNYETYRAIEQALKDKNSV